MSSLSHFDSSGDARMVDTTGKMDTQRTARAHAFVRMSGPVIQKLAANPKGDPLEVAKIAGIMAAKRTADLIPMCHPLPLRHVDVQLSLEGEGVRIITSASTTGPTGVEMEAMTAAAVAALTVYDMTKALDKAIEIQDLWLIQKTGGKSGEYVR